MAADVRPAKNRLVLTDSSVFRRGSPSRQTPDFSKVEPRVCFPRSGYTPPRSKQPLTRTTPEPPMAFKSPADIVNEVLFNTDRSSTPSGSPTHAANFTVPPEFRCRQQASTLIQQLQVSSTQPPQGLHFQPKCSIRAESS